MAKKASATPTPTADEDQDQPAQDQVQAMDDLFSAANEIEPPASNEDPSAQPAPKMEPAAKADDQPKDGAQEPKAEAMEPEQPAGETEPGDDPAQAKTAKQDKEKEEGDSVSYDVITKEGVRSVPVKNLITTYQQFGDLQRRHVALKPILDIAEKAGITADALLPYIELGVKTAYERQQTGNAKAAPAAQGAPVETPQGYNGPFKDEKEDAYYKDVEPAFHATQWRLWERANSSASLAPDLARRLEMIEQSVTQRQRTEQEAATREMQQRGYQAIEKRITDWSGDKQDYFKDPATGPQRLEAFREFLITRYPETKISDLSPEFLSAVFAQFDPKFYGDYARRLAMEKANPRLFAEGGGSRRGQAPAKLEEQQGFMADLMEI